MESKNPDSIPGPTSDELSSEDILKALLRNADGDAGLFIRLYRGRFVYDCSAGTWFVWGGNYWAEDFTGQVIQAVSGVVEVYEIEAQRQAWLRAKAAKDSNAKTEAVHRENQSALLKRIRLLQSLPRKQEILFLSRSGAGTLAITGNEWDLNPWLLAVKNVVINLRTTEARPGSPGDYIKTAAPTVWMGLNKSCTAWEKFLGDIFGNDQELIKFMQRLLGYGITGLSILHLFILLYGTGRNAKGTLMENLRFVLGDYAMKTESELLLEQKYARQAGSPNSGVLSLRGRRIVWASETSDGRRLNAGKLKELVGGDTLNARPIFGKHHIQFEPSHLLFFMTNSKPSAPASDYALWQRVLLIPFERAFVDDPKTPNESKADPYLNEKLRRDAPGILSWLVKGCLSWQEEGLNPPDIVKAATEGYRLDEDALGQFFDDRCILGESYQIRALELFQAWKMWAEDNGISSFSGKRFGMEIQRRGFDWFRDKKGKVYLGIGLRGDG